MQGKLIAEVGKFRIYAGGTIEGPKNYIESPAFARCMESINSGRNVLVSCGYNSTNPYVAALVAIQTDYAAWLGLQELSRMGRHQP